MVDPSEAALLAGTVVITLISTVIFMLVSRSTTPPPPVTPPPIAPSVDLRVGGPEGVGDGDHPSFAASTQPNDTSFNNQHHRDDSDRRHEGGAGQLSETPSSISPETVSVEIIQVFTEAPSATHFVNVRRDATVGRLKQKAFPAESANGAVIRLIHGGRVLNDREVVGELSSLRRDQSSRIVVHASIAGQARRRSQSRGPGFQPHFADPLDASPGGAPVDSAAGRHQATNTDASGRSGLSIFDMLLTVVVGLAWYSYATFPQYFTRASGFFMVFLSALYALKLKHSLVPPYPSRSAVHRHTE